MCEKFGDTGAQVLKVAIIAGKRNKSLVIAETVPRERQEIFFQNYTKKNLLRDVQFL